VNLSDVATDCALLFEPVAFEAGKPLEYEMPEDVSVTGDGEKLRQLLGSCWTTPSNTAGTAAPVRLTAPESTEKHARLQVDQRKRRRPHPAGAA
jgi:two-component system sensor histidine kinase CiaH